MSLDAQINFRTSSETKKKIQELAEARGIKQSEMMNEIVESFLGNMEAKDSKTVNLESIYEIVNLHSKKLEVHEQQLALLAKK